MTRKKRIERDKLIAKALEGTNFAVVAVTEQETTQPVVLQPTLKSITAVKSSNDFGIASNLNYRCINLSKGFSWNQQTCDRW
jgi:G:T-mismatch repair DNA endonuclease (very short patch repair protein)